MENLYLLLQVNEKASKTEIEKAYKKLVKKYHPDISKDKIKAEEMMKKINNAYDILGDAEKRKEYDQELITTRERIKQKEARSSGVGYADENSNNEDVKQKYDTYYGEKSYTTYKKDYQYSQNRNIYNEHNDSYYDYINHLNFFQKILSLNSVSRRIAVILVVLIILGLYTIYVKIKHEFANLTNKEFVAEQNGDYDDNTMEYINDDTPKYEYLQFVEKLKNKQFYILNSYLHSNNKLTDSQIKNLTNNSELFDSIVKHMTITVKECNVTNKGVARISVSINRIDVESLLINIAYYEMYGNNTTFSRNIKEKLKENIKNENYIQKTVNDVVWVVKEENNWKIQFTNNNLYNHLGIDLSSEI